MFVKSLFLIVEMHTHFLSNVKHTEEWHNLRASWLKLNSDELQVMQAGWWKQKK